MTDTPQQPEPERGTDTDLLRRALAWFSEERNAQSTSRYRRAAAPLSGEVSDRSSGAPGSPQSAATPRTPSDSAKQSLLELESLYNEGFITIDEYKAKRAEILDRL